MTISKRIITIVLSLTLIITMMPLASMSYYSYAVSDDAEEQDTGVKVDPGSINLVGTIWEWTRPSLEDGGYADYYEVSLYHAISGDAEEQPPLVSVSGDAFELWKSFKVAVWDTGSHLQDQEYYYISIRAAADRNAELGESVTSKQFKYNKAGLTKPADVKWEEVSGDSTKATWKNDAHNPNGTEAAVKLYRILNSSETEQVGDAVVVSADAAEHDFSAQMEEHNTYYFTVQFQYMKGTNEEKLSTDVPSNENRYKLLVVDAPEKFKYVEGYGFTWDTVEEAVGYTLSIYKGEESTLVSGIRLKADETNIKINDNRLSGALEDGEQYTIEIKSLGDQFTSVDSEEPSSIDLEYVAPEFYDNVFVGSLEINDQNCDNIVPILHDVIGEDASGNAVYSESSKTMTFTNFSYQGLGMNNAAITLKDDSIISVAGNNTIKCTTDGGIGVKGNVKLSGNGKLSVTADYSGFDSSVNIDGPAIVVNANQYGFSSYDGTLAMNKGELTVITPISGVAAVHSKMKTDINKNLVYKGGLSSSENRVRTLPEKGSTFAERYPYIHIGVSTDISDIGGGGGGSIAPGGESYNLEDLATGAVLSKSSYVYNDAVQVPTITIKNNGKELLELKDYELAYYTNAACTSAIESSKIENAGTYYIKVSGKGEYSGYFIKSFVIAKCDPEVINGTTYTYNGQRRTGNVVFKGAYSKVLLNAKTSAKNPGTYTIKYPGDRNYNPAQGTWKIKLKPTGISKLSGGKKSFTVKVKKQAKNYVGGYQVRYSRESDMLSYTVQTIGNKYTVVSKKIGNLKSGKKYYVQVRTYKNIGGNRYYSSWSSKKSVKTK